VMELLGVGGILLSILLEGGITTDDIMKMALDALIVAIPIALVAILIEKLVSMIVPAAGAVLAIIEGLQAAWGTISRIIAAFGAFMAFLLAVQGGGAGPLFATALAAAAIVLLDFVSNWLLRKLAGPARKVGARLKGMGDKLKNKVKGKGKGPKGAKGPRKGKDGPDGPGAKGTQGATKTKPAGKSKDPSKKKDPKKKEDRTRAEVKRLARAAAQRAWRAAQSRTRRTVLRQGDVAAVVKRGHPSGVSADVQVTGGGWSVRATAKKGAHQATASAGRGYILRDRGGASWLVGTNLSAFNRQLVRDIGTKLQHGGGDKDDLEAEYRAKKSLATRLQAEGQRRLNSKVSGLRFLVTMESFTGAEKDRRIATKVIVTPNTEEFALDVPLTAAPGLEPLRKELAKIMGKLYQMADRIELRVRKAAGKHKADMKMTPYGSAGGGSRDFRIVLSKGGDQLVVFIQLKSSVAECPACQVPAQAPESRPHFHVPQSKLEAAIGAALLLPKYAALPTSATILANGGDFVGPSTPAAMKGNDQKQCTACENKHAAFSLVQRVDNAASNPTSTDDLVGKQAGGKGLSKTEATELTRQRLHQHIYPHMRRKLAEAKYWPTGWPTAATREATIESFIRAVNSALWPTIR
jgi:hypothetical protein